MYFKNTYIYAAVITNIIDLGTTHIINNVDGRQQFRIYWNNLLLANGHWLNKLSIPNS